jgi:transposase
LRLGRPVLERKVFMPGKKPPYPPEFRAEAVRLYRSSDKSLKTVSDDLGISSESLRAWLKQTDLDTGVRTDGLTTEEREELRKLRRENRVLKEEREILKKAAAFFAQETNSIR